MNSFYKTLLLWAALGVLIGGAFIGCCLLTEHIQNRSADRAEEVADLPPPPPEVLPGLVMGFPTAQTNLTAVTDPTVYMPTASGRVVSALYGSTRTRKFGSRFLAAFHEGMDIAPMSRDSRQAPKDLIHSVADGKVAYISRRGGNSSYGTYVVMAHKDRVGEYYTLYAHLASVPKGLSAGDVIERGTEIGIMGHSSTLGIPVQRSHLHIECGTMLNSRFSSWLKSKKMTGTHGNYHGYNLVGLNPAEMVPFMISGKPFDFQTCMLETPVAFKLLVAVKRKPNYYERYPVLWSGEAPQGAIVMEVSEGGVPLRGRAATADEKNQIKGKKWLVLEGFPDVLGRNGKRLVGTKSGKWIPGSNLPQWLDIFLYR